MIDFNNVNIIGLTGMSGAGKSTVSQFFEENGFYKVDCDKTANRVIARPPCVDEVRVRFPEMFMNGGFDRKKAGAAVFRDSSKLEEYQKTVFPYVVYEILDIIEKSKSRNILLDASTLFQSGADDFCGRIIAVVADKQICVSRIIKRDGITEESALMRLMNQPDEDFFRKNADCIIENNKGLENLTQAIRVCNSNGFLEKNNTAWR